MAHPTCSPNPSAVVYLVEEITKAQEKLAWWRRLDLEEFECSFGSCLEVGRSSQFQKNYFAETCSGSKEGSYSRHIDFSSLKSRFERNTECETCSPNPSAVVYLARASRFRVWGCGPDFGHVWRDFGVWEF
jgi:hypothetical protein